MLELGWSGIAQARAQNPPENKPTVGQAPRESSPTRGPSRGVPPGSLAAYAPAPCTLFLQIERPGNINPSLRDVNGWKLLQLVLGREIAETDNPNDWYDVLVANLAGGPTAAMQELFSERAALVAPAWTRFSDGVILLQVPYRAVLRCLVGPGMVKTERQENGLSIYETTGGLLIATDGRTVVLAQRKTASELFSSCVGLLGGKRGDSLLNTPEFAQSVRGLPNAPPQGFLYFSSEAPRPTTMPTLGTASATGPTSQPGLFGSRLRAGVVGMYVRDLRVDFLFRASANGPPERARPRVDLERIKHLPRSTVAAWATAIDVEGWFDRLIGVPTETALGPYAVFLTEAMSPEELRMEVLRRIGPRVILVWGHYFVGEEGRSSLGVLLESTDIKGLRQAVEEQLRKLVGAINSRLGHAGEEGFRITTEDVSGVEVTVLELSEYLATKPSTTLPVQLASTMRPCYAALENGLLLAWDVDHMRELITAHFGMQPVLGEFTDVSGIRLLLRGPTVLGVGQLASAATVLEEWLDRIEQQPDMLLGWYARGPAREFAGYGRWLGLGLAPQVRPGLVPVARVYPDGPCFGRLEPGDELVALNGRVFDLEDANGDLRRRVRELKAGESVTVRLQRAGTLMDVHVVVDRPKSPEEKLLADALRALRRVQELSRQLVFATFAVTQDDAEVFQAHLRLRFSDRH